MNRFNLDERQLRTNITIPVGDDLVEFNAYEYALSVVETIQRVQFALYYSHNKTHSYDLGHNSLREIEDFIKVAELAGLYIEAWLKSHEKAWGVDVDFTTVIERVGDEGVAHFGEYICVGVGYDDMKKLVNRIMEEAVEEETHGSS